MTGPLFVVTGLLSRDDAFFISSPTANYSLPERGTNTGRIIDKESVL